MSESDALNKLGFTTMKEASLQAASSISVVTAAFQAFAPAIGVAIAALLTFAGIKLWQNYRDKEGIGQVGATNRFNNAIEDYDQQTETLSDLNNELDVTKEKVEELQLKGHLSLVEQQDLVALQQENKLLEQKIKLQEQLVEAAAEETSASADNYLRQSLGEAFVNPITGAQYLLESYAQYEKARDDAYEDLINTVPDASDYESKRSTYEDAQETLTSFQTSLAGKVEEINEKAKYLDPKESQDLIDMIDDINNQFINLNFGSAASKRQDTIDGIFEKVKFQKVRDKLEKQILSGASDSELSAIIDDNQALSMLFGKKKINTQEVIDYLKSQVLPDKIDIGNLRKTIRTELSSNATDLLGFDEWSKDFSEDDWSVVYRIHAEFDTDEWDLKDWKNKFREETKGVSKTDGLLNLFKNSETQEITNLDDELDQFQTRITSISEVMQKLKTGEFQSTDITDLIQQFPELARHLESLDINNFSGIQDSLNKINIDFAKESISSIYERMKDVPGGEEVGKAMIASILAGMDLSNVDLTKHDFLNSIANNMGATKNQKALKNFAKLYDEYGGTVEGREAIFKMSLDTSNFDLEYNELASMLDQYVIPIEVRINNEEISKIQASLANWQAVASAKQAEMELNESRRIKTTANDYAELYNNATEQLILYNAELQKEAKNLEYYRNNRELNDPSLLLDKNYQDTLSKMSSLNSEINSLQKSQIEWENTITNLPLTNIQNLGSALSSAFSELNENTGLTTETMNALMLQFSDLQDGEFENIFYRTEKGMSVNQKQLERLTAQEYRYQNALLKEQIAQAHNNTEKERESALLREQAQLYAQYIAQMQQFSKYQAVQNAKNTPNQGEHYDSIKTDYETQKKAFENGLIGTDDFKTYAAYIDEYGFEDYMTFSKNLPKLTRYMGGDDEKKNMLNFLNDLKKQGLATYDEATQGWHMNVGSIEDAAHKMDMGYEFFTDMLSKLEDYGFNNSVVASMEQAEAKTSDLTDRLGDARIKLAQLQRDGADTTAIEKQKEVIADLESQVDEVDVSTQKLEKDTTTSYANQVRNAQEYMDLLKEQYANATSESERQKLLDEAQQYAEDHNLEFTGEVKDFIINEDSQAAEMERLGIKNWEHFKQTLDGSAGPLYDNPAYLKAAGALYESLGKQNTQEGVRQNAEELLNYSYSDIQQVAKGLSEGITDFGDNAAFNNIKDSLSNIIDLTELEATDAKALVLALKEAGMINPDIDISALEKSIDSVDDDLADAKKKIDNLDGSEIKISYEIDELNLDNIDDAIEEVEMQINAEMDPDSKAALEAYLAELENKKCQLQVEAFIEEGGSLDEVMAWAETPGGKEALMSVGIDGVETLDETVAAIHEFQKANGTEAKMTVNISDESISKLTTGTATITGNNETALQKVQEVIDEANKADAVVKVGASIKGAVTNLNTLANKIRSTSGDITVGIKSGLTDQVQKALNARTYSITINGKVASVAGSVSVPLRTTTVQTSRGEHSNGGTAMEYTGTVRNAHADGTAIPIARAHANGDVTIQQDEESLVNELGYESRIRQGVWSIIPGGPHVEKLKKGDIIFNH